MTHGGLQKLGNGMAMTYPRPSAIPAGAGAMSRPAEEPIAVDVSVRLSSVENAYTGASNYDSGPGQHLDCYI